MSTIPFPRSSLILNENSSFSLEVNSNGLTLISDSKLLFELKEPVLLAQGIAEGPDQIHLAFLKATGELCYSIISTTGAQHTTTLGRLDTRVNRYDRLVLLPVGRVIHIFYAASHLALPDVWRITHLFWNGKAWKSAQLGEVVHPRHPLYHVLVDSKSNLHVLMMTFLGNRSVLLSSFFNGTFHVWSNRQEALSIPREVIDMTAIITPSNQGYVFWAARQPGSDMFEISYAIQPKVNDFTSSWRIENNPVVNITGPWRGLGILFSEGVLSLLISADQERLVQFNNRTWILTSASSTQHSSLCVVQRTESLINYTNWLKNDEPNILLFSKEAFFTLPRSPQLSTEISDSSAESENLPLESKEEESPNLILPIEETSKVSPEQPELKQSDPVESPVDPTIEQPNLSIALANLIHSLSETTSSLTNNLQSVGDKISTIPEVLQFLIRKNEETLQSLRLLEDKVNQISLQQETEMKKGFWEKWFT